MTPRNRSLSVRELAHWRQWAALLTLATDLDGYAFTSVIANRTNTLGWRVWPENPREWTPACRRALERAERNHMVEAERGNGEVYWHLTDIGRDFVGAQLCGNPHITPEKFLEASGVWQSQAAGPLRRSESVAVGLGLRGVRSDAGRVGVLRGDPLMPRGRRLSA